MTTATPHLTVKLHDAIENQETSLSVFSEATIDMLRSEAVAWLAPRLSRVSDLYREDLCDLDINGLLELRGELQEAAGAVSFLIALEDQLAPDDEPEDD